MTGAGGLMLWIVIKYLTTAAIVVLVSEVAKRSDKMGALVAALPTVTILALVWMYIEGQESSKLSNHAFYTFWYVLPTLPMFLLFPYLLGPVDLCCTFYVQQYIGSHISMNASDTMLA